MFDVDSKDSSLGMSSPPRPFVTPEFLATVKQILHHSQGMFVLNLACRDPLLRSEVIQDIHRVFQTVWSYKVPEEVNEILFCTDHEWSNAKKISKKHPAVEAFGQVNSHITKRIIKDGMTGDKSNLEDEFLDLSEAMKQLKLV